MSSLLLTSGYNFEGYRIIEYLDFCSGESAVGTGFLSSWGASFADFTGKNSIMYSGKLDKAKNIALENLKQKAAHLGANAIIGVTVHFTSFSEDIMGVISTGTAVKIEKLSGLSGVSEKTDPITSLHVYNYNPSIPIRPMEVLMRVIDTTVSAALSIYDTKENKVTRLDTDLIFENTFGDPIECKHVYFGNFQQNYRRRTSDFVSIPLPLSELPVKRVKVKVKRYIDQEKIVIPSNDEVAGDLNVENPAGGIAEFIEMIEAFHSAKEILECALKFNEEHDDVLDQTLIKFIESQVKIERLYGCRPGDCVKAIREFMADN